MILDTDKLTLDEMATFTRAIAIACEEMAMHILSQVKARPSDVSPETFETALTAGLVPVAAAAGAIAEAGESLAAAARMFRQVASRGHYLRGAQPHPEKP